MAIRLGHSNFGYSTLTADVQIGTLTFQVQSGDVTKFPLIKPFKATLWNPNYVSPFASPDVEIVEMTYVSGTTFSVLRGQENTIPNNWNEGTPIYAGMTSGLLTELETYMDSEGGLVQLDRLGVGIAPHSSILLNVLASVGNAIGIFADVSGSGTSGIAICGRTSTDRTLSYGVEGMIIGEGTVGYGVYAEAKNATALKCRVQGTGRSLEVCGSATFGSSTSAVLPYNRCVSIDATGYGGYALYIKGNESGGAAIFAECPTEGAAVAAGNDGTAPAVYINNFLLLYPRGSDPSTPSEGAVWYNSAEHKLKCWDGTQARACW